MSMSAATEQIMFDEMMRVRKRGKYSPRESNYTRLFGTPERAARTLHELCGGCCGLPERIRGDYDALLEWLKGASDGE